MAVSDLDRSLARLERISTLGMVVAAAATVGMMLLVTVEVIARGLFSFSTLISDEVAGYLLVLATFLGGAHAIRTGAFIRVEVFYGRLHGRAKQVVDVLLLFTALIYGVALFVYVLQYFQNNYQLGITSVTTVRTPLWIPQLAMVAGMAGVIVQLIAELLRELLALFGLSTYDLAQEAEAPPTL